jgi:BirA family transcriptional regulator, biotin operon repressor / biotin---[acetyl-CoA-carboxylase] ligase
MTRTAISPRFATKTLSNTPVWLAEMTPEWEVPSVTAGPIDRRPAPAGTRFVGVAHVVETGSTNADLLDVVRTGRPRDGMVLVTDHQTAGRGRQGRVWHDRPARSLLVSVLLQVGRERAGLVPLATGLAAVEALEGCGPVGARLKWPNDVLVPSAGERKVAGILAEATTRDDELWVVVGMGLNLSWPDDRPDELLDRLVALDEVVPGVARDELLDRWLVRLDRRLSQLEREPGALLADYRRACLSIGRQVRMATPGGEVHGLVEDVGDDGALLLRTEGSLVRLDAGDVHHI